MSTIVTKNSSTASAVPLAGDLVKGELAVNVTDKKLYTKDNSATVVKVVGSLGNQEANAVAITGGTVAGVAQTGGTINNTPVGATTASTVRGTTVTATTGFVGDLTGSVTGNTTGVHTGAVTGNVTGNLTGNVTAATGTSTFNHVTISGSLDMDAGTTATITGLATPVNNTDAATKIYVDTAISNLVDGAPANLDTLNEIAAALNDDANLAATLTASIATKVSKAGDSMTGALAMGTNKITGLGTPTAGTDATTKTYVDTADALKLNLAGGTMSGAIVMGSNKITGLGTPTADADATTKVYVDGILGSATSAAASASAAATSATNAANSATSSANSATASAASASSAAASFDSFDDRYLGAKSSAPSVDNDGNTLLTGALYWNSTVGELNVWSGSAWVPSALTTGAQTISGVKTFASNPILSSGTANGVTYLNGSKVLTTGSALTYNGTTLSLSGGAISNSNSGNENYFLSDGSTQSTLQQSSNTLFFNVNASSATNGQFIWRSSSAYSEQMRLTSTGLGIGTSSPLARLTVSDSSNPASGTMTLGNNASFNGTLQYLIGPGELRISQVGSSSLGTTFYTNGAERMRLDSSGNLGLGVTPSAWSTGKAIEVGSFGNALYSFSATNLLVTSNAYFNGGFKYGTTAVASAYQQDAGVHKWLTAPSGTAGNAISFTQAMTLDASSNLLLGTTSTTYGSIPGKFTSCSATAGSAGLFYTGFSGDVSTSALNIGKFDNDNSTAQIFVKFGINNAGTGSGQINANGGGAVAFGSFSDRRLKENIEPLPSQLSSICALNPVEFDYKTGGHQIGFIAQEMQEIYPDTVGENSDGMLSITGWSKTEARLVKSIQEQQAIITALNARVAALESN